MIINLILLSKLSELRNATLSLRSKKFLYHCVQRVLCFESKQNIFSKAFFSMKNFFSTFFEKSYSSYKIIAHFVQFQK
jgi:hypothetical protein